MTITLTPPAETTQEERAAERLRALLLAHEARTPGRRPVAEDLYTVGDAPEDRFNWLLIGEALRVTVSLRGGKNRGKRMQNILHGPHVTLEERADARRFVRAYNLLRRLVLAGVRRSENQRADAAMQERLLFVLRRHEFSIPDADVEKRVQPEAKRPQARAVLFLLRMGALLVMQNHVLGEAEPDIETGLELMQDPRFERNRRLLSALVYRGCQRRGELSASAERGQR